MDRDSGVLRLDVPRGSLEAAGYALTVSMRQLLALVGRDKARDFLDTLMIHEQVLPLGAQCWAAAGKAPPPEEMGCLGGEFFRHAGV